MLAQLSETVGWTSVLTYTHTRPHEDLHEGRGHLLTGLFVCPVGCIIQMTVYLGPCAIDSICIMRGVFVLTGLASSYHLTIKPQRDIVMGPCVCVFVRPSLH